MKKTLRVLCMSVAAVFSVVSFAQTNETSKLRNADMEKGVIGWDITFEGGDIWKKTTKNQATQPSYYGVENLCLEVWKASKEPVTNSSISQTVRNLPNGTYVFGAYMLATDQGEENLRENIEGVSIFANDAATRVATNTAQNADTIWAHTAKFNVATTVTDGTLKVGVNVKETNASFVLMDNATLYYFANMEPADALNEMAKIDIAATIAIADTCLANKMNAVIRAALNEAREAAAALTTDAELYTADENLYWNIRQAVKSIKDYNKLAAAIKTAKEAIDNNTIEASSAIETLTALVSEAETVYEDGTAEREGIESITAQLEEAIAFVGIDNTYILYEEYDVKITDLPVGDGVGEYTEDMIYQASLFMEEILIVLSTVEEGEISAVEALSDCNALFRKIDEIINNPNTADEFPLTIARSSEPLNNKTIMKGSYLDENGLARFKSKTYNFDYPLQKLRFVIKQNGNNSNDKTGYPFVALSDFAMYDEYGDPIELTEDMVTSNAEYGALNPGKKDGDGISGLIDGDLGTYFHSSYANGPAEYHYIEVTLPEGEYSGFSFTMAARTNSEFHTGQFPAEMEIQHLSEAAADLEAAIAEAKKFKPYFGVEPGFYNTDIAPYKEAIAAAEALVDTDASDAEVYAAIAKIAKVRAQIEAVGIVMPNPEKEYRIVAGVEFFKFQGVHKAISLFNGGGYYNQLGWQTACPDSLVQLFTFEPMESGDDRFTYAVKHVATGKYVSRYYDEEGYEVPNAFGLSAEPEEVELVSLGEGQFGIKCGELAGNNNSNMMHTNGYNNGNGNANILVKWNSVANGGSAWYIREMSTLPCAAKNISELQFESERIHLYEGINTITLTAEKECAFEDFKLYDLHGDVIPTTITTSGASATVMLDNTIASFSFSFANTEGVANVTVNGSISTLSVLQEAYDAALAVAPVKSDEVGQYGDISEYEAALGVAHDILIKGGSDEEIRAAVQTLEEAVANLSKHINYPDADKSYFLLAGYGEFKKINGIDMAIFAETGFVNWSYVNIDNESYRWRFVEGEPSADGKRAFYIQNVATELYMGVEEAIRIQLAMVDATSDTQAYNIHRHTDGSVALSHGSIGGLFLHFNSHSNGAGVYGDVIYWSGAGGASAVRIVEADEYIDEYLKELSVEEITIPGEVAPAVKGTFDLFGRRISTPTASGIYIIDGVKRVVK